MFGCSLGSHLKHFFSSRIFGQISGWMPDNKKAGYLVQPYTIAINIYFLHIPAKT